MVATLLEPKLQVINKGAWIPPELKARINTYSPKTDLGRIVKECFKYLPPHMAGELLETISRSVVAESRLDAIVYRSLHRVEYKTHSHEFVGDRCILCGDKFIVENLGMIGNKVVTTTGVNYIVDAFQNITELENFKYHGIGTDAGTSEAAGNTGLTTELTTEYNPNNTRATGTTAEGASANIFQTVGTNTLDGTPGAALREHGVFSASSAGTLLDRTVYSAITLSSGDAIQTTYELTFSSGG